MKSLECSKEYLAGRIQSGDYTIERLDFSRNDISVRVCRAIFGYSPTGTEKERASWLSNGSVVWLARLEAWVRTVVKRLTEKETSGGHRRMLCTEIYWRLMLLSMEQPIGIVHVFVESLVGEELVSRRQCSYLKVVQTLLNG